MDLTSRRQKLSFSVVWLQTLGVWDELVRLNPWLADLQYPVLFAMADSKLVAEIRMLTAPDILCDRDLADKLQAAFDAYNRQRQ